MAKEGNNKETGVEKTPVLTEDKGADNKSEKEVTNKITPEEIAELKDAIEEYKKLDVINTEKIGILLKENAELEESIKEKDGVIKELEGTIALFNTNASNLGVNAELAGQNLGNAVRVAEEHVALVRFLLSPAGKFKLPYNVGQVVSLHKEVAAEIVESAYAEYVVEEE